MASLEADPAYRAGDLDPDAAWYRIHFQPALQRQELLDDLVGRLRRGSSAEGIVAARAIEQRLYDETWRAEDYDVLARLQRLSVPTLLLHGDADFIPVELARQLAEAIPGSRLEVLADCGHFPFLDQPDVSYAPSRGSWRSGSIRGSRSAGPAVRCAGPTTPTAGVRRAQAVPR